MGPTPISREQDRIAQVVPRFLEPLLSRRWDILSIGCGAGTDVIELRRRGYNAWGLDPSRLVVERIPPEHQPFVKVGKAEDVPFGDRKFDFVYGLDVIEHVGCVDFGTRLKPDARQIRKEFLAGCLRAVKPGGSLVLTSSNRLCPIDPGHWHGYHWLGRCFPDRKKMGVSIPWSSQNFLLSLGDFRALLLETIGSRDFRVEALSASRYPSFVEKNTILSRLGRMLLGVLDAPLLRGSPFAPILVVRVDLIAPSQA